MIAVKLECTECGNKERFEIIVKGDYVEFVCKGCQESYITDKNGVFHTLYYDYEHGK